MWVQTSSTRWLWGTKEGKTPLPGTLNTQIRPWERRPEQYLYWAPHTCKAPCQHRPSLYHLVSAHQARRRLLQLSPPGLTRPMRPGAATCSRYFAGGDRSGAPAHPAAPGVGGVPLRGLSHSGGRFPLLSSQPTFLPASHPAVNLDIAYPDHPATVVRHDSQKEVSSSQNLQLSPLPRLHPRGLLRVGISAISWMSPGLRTRSQSTPINEDTAAILVT
jgi:hypothetical protein